MNKREQTAAQQDAPAKRGTASCSTVDGTSALVHKGIWYVARAYGLMYGAN